MLHCSESSPDVSLANPTMPVTSEWAPKFLVPVLQQVILAGKSMEMLQNLGRLSDVLGKQDISTFYFLYHFYILQFYFHA